MTSCEICEGYDLGSGVWGLCRRCGIALRVPPRASPDRPVAPGGR